MFIDETVSCVHRRHCVLRSQERLLPVLIGEIVSMPPSLSHASLNVPCYSQSPILLSKPHATLKVPCYSQSSMLLSTSHATLKVPCYYGQILVLNWTGDIPKLSQGHPRSPQSYTWVLAWARPGWGMAWDGKVSFRVHETLLFPMSDYLPDLLDLGKMVHEPALRPSLPHAPAVRMTVVTH